MRLPLDPRRDGSQLVGRRGQQAPVIEAPAPERDHVVATSVTLVLDEDSPLPESVADVVELRGTIHREDCDKGFDPVRNTFTQYYGSQKLDAATLLTPRTGFLPPDDSRVIGTVDAVRRELSTNDGLVYRHPTLGRRTGVDGLPGGKDTFFLCDLWLVDGLALTGRLDEARALLERLLALRNDLGLLAEEYDPVQQRQLGNFPQAFGHMSLIRSALLLQRLTPGPSRHRGAVAVSVPRSTSRSTRRTAADLTPQHA